MLRVRSKLEQSYWKRKVEIDAKVLKIDRMIRIPMYFGSGFKLKYKHYLLKHTSISLKPEPFFNRDYSLPEIEVTIDCAEKDINMLNIVILYLVSNTLNPISLIYVISPSNLIERIESEIKKLNILVPILVSDENQIISEEIRSRIKNKFPDRYGWILHQFLTLQQVLNARKKGILSIDCDTILLRPMAFLNNSGTQILMESLEFHAPYYEFLNKIDSNYPVITPTHVTHYSFFQKDIMLSLLKKVNCHSLEMFFDFIDICSNIIFYKKKFYFAKVFQCFTKRNTFF